MSTKHFCDVCGKESRLERELYLVNKDVKGSGLCFHACLQCSRKMFKPVKEFSCMATIEINYKKEE